MQSGSPDPLDVLQPRRLRRAAPASLRRARLIVFFSLVLAAASAGFVPLLVWPGRYVIALLSVGTLGLAFLFERANDRMRAALEARNAALREVLDNVGQGFVCADRDGQLVGDRSAAAEQWFGAPAAGQPLWGWLGRHDAAFGDAAQVGWVALWEGVLPLELCLDQLPPRMARSGASFGVEYRPVTDVAGALLRVVVVITDITQLLVTERAERRQREFAAALDHALHDRTAFVQFVEEVDAMFARLSVAPQDAGRILHTVKGNCALFGVRSVAEACHRLESGLHEPGALPTPEAVAELRAKWDDFRGRVGAVLGERTGIIDLDRCRYTELLDATRAGVPHDQLYRMVTALAFESAALPLARVADQARALARRLGRPSPEVHLDDGGLLVDPEAWRELWAGFVHVVRNAVDHGLESADHREARGKRARGTLWLAMGRVEDRVFVELVDDGQGVDWDRVAERAKALGLRHTTRADLVEAVFADGVSTRYVATEVSGRGVGMGAFRDAARALGGEVGIQTERGVGTRVRVYLPGHMAMDAADEEEWLREVG
jgi:two-component system chemotaxis sensor kinase CheA